VTFARYNDLTYRILGYSSPEGFDRHGRDIGATLSSFGALTDLRVLDVQPRRLTTTTLTEAMSLNTFVRSFPQPVDIEELARLNRVLPSAVISAGTRIKTISGTPVG
jgi:hypothetical protein